MSNTYERRHEANSANPKKVRKWSRKRKVGLIAAVAALAFLPATAFAAVDLFGFGRLNSAAAVTQNLTVNNRTAQLTGRLVPGSSVGARVTVTNPNKFPVTVTGVIIRVDSLTVTPNIASCEASVHLVGTDIKWPVGDADAVLQRVAKPVTIPPGRSVPVEVPNVVRQDLTATVLCGVGLDFAVRAQPAG